MNIVRQNTDYAFRILLNLARRYPNGQASARLLAKQEDITYQFTCKILQILRDAGLVDSHMGPKGGYHLAQPPQNFTMADVVKAAQGPIAVNGCVLNLDYCPRQPHCPVSEKLAQLQEHLDHFLSDVSLAQLLETRDGPGDQTNLPEPKRSTPR